MQQNREEVNAVTALVVITAEAVTDAVVGVSVVGGVGCDVVGVTAPPSLMTRNITELSKSMAE